MACSCSIEVTGRFAKGGVCPSEEGPTKQILVLTIFSYFVDIFIITFLFNINTKDFYCLF